MNEKELRIHDQKNKECHIRDSEFGRTCEHCHGKECTCPVTTQEPNNRDEKTAPISN